MEIVLVLILCIAVFIVIYAFQGSTKNAKRALRRNTLVTELEDKYGKCTASAESVTLKVFAFDSSNTLYIDKETFNYDDIIDCSVDSYIKETIVTTQARTETTVTTNTSGKSIAGRTVAGAIIAGPVGAVVGGLTAKKNTTITTKEIPATQRTHRATRYRITINAKTKTITKETPDEQLANNIQTIINKVAKGK